MSRRGSEVWRFDGDRAPLARDNTVVYGVLQNWTPPMIFFPLRFTILNMLKGKAYTYILK